MWENICRICSSRGEYDIFSVIPAYLHASSNEFLHWKQQINQLLEDTTGLVVSPNDGLPNKMCALCISYLKHAANFRQQAIDNTLNLKAAIALSTPTPPPTMGTQQTAKDNHNDKESILITANDLIFSEKRKTETNSLVNNLLNNQTGTGCSDKTDDYLKKLLLLKGKNERNKIINCDDDRMENGNALIYLNMLFDKDINAGRSPMKTRRGGGEHMRQNSVRGQDEADEFQTASSDDNEAYEQKKNFFSYREKNFEEDDVMDLDELKEANITINVPESCKERKCRACFRRFMFEDSFKEHMDVCIEYKFLLLIEEINRLLDIRRSKAVSPHEFIRRMIFSLRKTCQWLKTSCGEILLPDLILNGEGKKRLESECKSSGAEISSGCKSDENINVTVVEKKKEDNPLLRILQQKADSSLIRYINKTPDPLLQRLKANESNFATSTPEVDTKKLELNLNQNLNKSEDENRISTALKLLSYSPRDDIQSSFKRIQTSSDDEEDQNRQKFLEKLTKANTSASTTPQPSKLMAPLFQKAQILPVSTTAPFPPVYPKISFSARCSSCNITFDAIASLEQHNAKFHNNRTKLDDHKKIIALFEEDEDDAVDAVGGISAN